MNGNNVNPEFFMKSFYLIAEMRECIERLRHEAAENGTNPEADEWYTALRDLRNDLDHVCSLMNAQINGEIATEPVSPDVPENIEYGLVRERVGDAWELIVDDDKPPKFQGIMKSSDWEAVQRRQADDISEMIRKWPELGLSTECFGDRILTCTFIGMVEFGVKYTIIEKKRG